MKTALIHDWLIDEGGAENVLRSIHKIYPSSVYTLISKGQEDFPTHTSFLQKIPFKTRFYRHLFPLYPLAVRQFDLKSYDVIISSSHAAAKGVRTYPHQLHLCYCHTPMRFMWDLHREYQKNLTPLSQFAADCLIPQMRSWDRRSAAGVHHFIANSLYVQERIKRIYQRESTVIYPPVDVEFFKGEVERKEDFYVTVARLVPYKKIDLMVEAFKEMPSKKLYVIGDGPEKKRLQRQASGNTIFLGFQPRASMKQYLQRARGFIFAAEEDFGIAPLEAQAAGTPVIAYGKGGALETVKEGVTGLFFEEETSSSLRYALGHFEARQWYSLAIQQWAENFSLDRFEKEFYSFVEQKWESFCESDRFSRR